MRRRAGSWGSIRATGNTAGALAPRPCARAFKAIAAGVLAFHAGLIVLAWQHQASKPPAARAPRLSVSLIAPRQPAVARDLRPQVAVAKKPAPAVARPKPVAKPVEVARPAEPAVAGVAFAPPAVGIPSPARWMQPPPPTAPPPMAMPPVHMAQALAARAQLTEALYRQLADAPSVAAGQCRLPASAPAQLDCDQDAMRDALQSRVAALADWLAAYRSVDASVSGISIAVADGRFQPTLVRTP